MNPSPRRVGLVGSGAISKLHLDGMQRHADRVTAVALLDPNEETSRSRAAEYGVAQTYTDLQAMIRGARLDAAIICTPTHIRSRVIVPLLEAGIPVFCEKPFAETCKEAALIAKRSKELGVPVAVNQNFRRHFAFSLVRDALADGRAGKPLVLTQIHKCERHDRGWRLTRDRYVMAVMSIHWFDAYRWLFGEEPVSVYCRGLQSPATEGGKDNAVSVMLEFPSGAFASLCESFSSFAATSACSLDCEKASFILEYGRAVRRAAGAEPVELKNPFDKPEATYYLLDDLLKAVDEGREPETSAADNVKSMAILEAAYGSFESGKPVSPREIVR
jgi:predicted dehydrogenase